MANIGTYTAAENAGNTNEKKEYAPREWFKLQDSQRIEGVVLEGAVAGESAFGKYVNLFLHDAESGKLYAHALGSTSKYGEKAVATLLELDENGWYQLKPQFRDKAIWFGKVARVGKRGQTYKLFDWGISENVTVVYPSDYRGDDQVGLSGSDTTPNSSEPTSTGDNPDDFEEPKRTIVLGYNNDWGILEVATRIMDNFGFEQTEAIKMVSEYFDSKR